MRLTLRTLLAYIDNQLGDEDAREIASKIARSEFAQNLEKRIKLLVHRQHLEDVEDGEEAKRPAAEIVANYMDNTLSGESVAEFERNCMASDVDLTEIADCHQILANLNQLAEVRPALRQRLYGVLPTDGLAEESFVDHSEIEETFEETFEYGDDPNEPFELAPPSSHAPIKDTQDAHSAGASQQVEELERKPRFSLVALLSTVASLSLLAFIVTYAIKSSESDSTLANNEPESSQTKTDDSGNSTDATNHNFAQQELAGPFDPSIDSEENEFPESDTRIEIAEAAESDFSPIATNDVRDSNLNNDANQANESVPSGGDFIPFGSAADSPAEFNAPNPVETANFEGGAPKPFEDDRTIIELDLRSAIEMPSDAVKRFGVSKSDPKEISAKVISENELLGYVDAERCSAIKSGGKLLGNQRIMSFPFFTAEIQFDDLNLKTAGASQFLLNENSSSNPMVDIVEGKLLFSCVNATSFEVRLNKTIQKLSVSPNSLVAVEVIPFLSPGSDPEKLRPVIFTQVICVAGSCNLNSDSSKHELSANEAIVFAPDMTFRSGKIVRLPKWVAKAGQNSGEQELADQKPLVHEIASKGSIDLALREAINNNSFENNPKALGLAEFVLSQFGDTKAMIHLLENDYAGFRRHWVWDEVMASARRVMLRNFESAAALRTDFASAFPEGQHYRLLAGFSDAQLERDSGDHYLVSLLTDESLAIRIMAIRTLVQITGEDLFFRPEKKQHLSKIDDWKKKQKEGGIRHVKATNQPTLVTFGDDK